MFKGTDFRRVEVVLPTRIGYERIAMDCSASFAKYWGTVDERIEDLKTAVAEACLNAMEHGNKGRPEARVVVTLDLEDDLMTIQVKDEGNGITQMPVEPDIRKKIEELEPARGLGLFLMKNLMDQVEFNEVTEQGHIVRMAIRLENPQPIS
ncbi:MAG: ATP-binding protein [Deltaproteobacteria bacterium]|nr:ATP-binding protein [Deltaproteobacteria bacterium]